MRRALSDAAVDATVQQATAIWGATIAVAAVGGYVLGSWPVALAGLFAGTAAPPLALRALRHRHERLLRDALPDFLDQVARSLRAGVSTVAALEEACPADGPLAGDLAAVLSDVASGRPLAAALGAWRERSALPDVNLVTAALSIGAATGGRRAPAVDGVAAGLRENQAARREVTALAMQGRLSGLVVALLPLGYLALSAMIDNNALDVLYRSPLGLFCLAAGLSLNAAAFIWMHRITRLR